MNRRSNLSSIPVVANLRSILTSISRIDSKIQFFSNDGSELSPSSIPNDNVLFDQSFAVFRRGGKHPSVMLGFEIRTHLSFRFIKKSLIPTLKTINSFVQPYNFPTWQNLDTVNIGFLYCQHPQFADYHSLQTSLLDSFNSIASELPECPEFQAYSTPEGGYRSPIFDLIRGKISIDLDDGRLVTDAIEIHVPRQDSTFLKHLLTKLPPDNDITIIPRSSRYSNSSLYTSFLSHHNDFMINHRNIKIQGIDPGNMNTPIRYDHRQYASLSDCILRASPITHIHHVPNHPQDGVWNLATTRSDWNLTVEWLDDLLAHLQTSTCRPKRLYRTNPSSSSSVVTQQTTDTYLSTLQSTILGKRVSIPKPTPTSNAWHSPPSISYELLDSASTSGISQPSNIQDSLQDPSVLTMETLANLKSEMEQNQIQFQTAIDARLSALEKQVTEIITHTLPTAVDTTLAAALPSHIAQISTSMEASLTAALDKIVSQYSATAASPPRKNARLNPPPALNPTHES